MKLSLEKKADLILDKVTGHDRRFDVIDQRFGSIETILGSLEGTVDAIAVEAVHLRSEMDDVKGRLGSLEEKFDHGFSRLDSYVLELNRQNLEILANRAAIARHEDRIEELEHFT